jgi:glycosyltransferase involved in cell wall biosynthesis
MKVLHIISNADIGGSQVHLLDILIHNATANDYEIIVICPDKGIYTTQFQKITTTYLIDFNTSFFNCLNQIYKIIKAEKPTIIHTHLTKAAIYGSIAGYRTNASIFHNLHTEVTDETTRSTLKITIYKYLYRILLGFGGKYIAISKYHQQKMVERKIPISKTIIVYNGTNETQFQQQQNPHYSDTFSVCTIARLHPQKGLDFLLDIAKTVSDISFSIYGEGELRIHLENRIQEERIKNVDLKGFSNDVSTILNHSDVFLLTSEWESFGLVITEAMACAKPIIASNVGGIPELLINEKGGYLCEYGNVQAFKIALTTLNNNKELGHEFGQYNLNRFHSHFTLTKMMTRLKQIYQE